MPGQVRNADPEMTAMPNGAAPAEPESESRGTSQITVADALRLPSVQRGLPEVLNDADLGQPIRWVHVTEDPKVSATLKGGELILTTGMVLNDEKAETERLIDELASTGAVGLIIELGIKMSAVPKWLAGRAAEAGLPLITLKREVAFVEITEAIHSEILAHQLTVFRRGEQVRAEFAAIASGGGGSPEVLAALADVIENPVVLEDHRGSLLYHASNGLDDRDVVAAWESRRESDSAGGFSLRCDSLGPGCHLIVLDLKSPIDELDRIAAEHAAEIISLLLLRPQHQELLRASERGNFLTELLDGQLTPREARMRSDALGFNTSGQVLMPMAIAPNRVRGEAHSRLWNALSRELESASYRSMLAIHPRLGDSMLLIAIRNAEQRRQTAERLAKLIGMVVAREAPGAPPASIAVGAACDWTDLADQIREALRTTEASAGLTPALWHDASAPNLERLLWNIARLPEVRRFAEDTLRPLVAQDERSNTALIETLEVLCKHNGRKTAAAEALHLRRQALHYRLNRIEGVLGADLEDENVRLGLHLAVRVRPYLDGEAPDQGA